jgi:hypothetical protein
MQSFLSSRHFRSLNIVTIEKGKFPAHDGNELLGSIETGNILTNWATVSF